MTLLPLANYVTKQFALGPATVGVAAAVGGLLYTSTEQETVFKPIVTPSPQSLPGRIAQQATPAPYFNLTAEESTPPIEERSITPLTQPYHYDSEPSWAPAEVYYGREDIPRYQGPTQTESIERMRLGW